MRSSLVLCALLAAGCSNDEGDDPLDGPVPDFSLFDVNATSPSYQTEVSPRDKTGRVSAWYFGHAT